MLYSDVLEMAKSLYRQHPDVTKIVWKFDRWQHSVDYSRFKRNKLIKRVDITIPSGVNNYGMVMKSLGAEGKRS